MTRSWMPSTRTMINTVRNSPENPHPSAANVPPRSGRLSPLRALEPPVLKRSGSTVTCPRVLPASPCGAFRRRTPYLRVWYFEKRPVHSLCRSFFVGGQRVAPISATLRRGKPAGRLRLAEHIACHGVATRRRVQSTGREQGKGQKGQKGRKGQRHRI